jgi:hypothetical protein
MPITYDWTVAQMDAYPEYEEHADVVFTVHWRLYGTDGAYGAGAYGSVGITLDPQAPYIPYADLTEAQVVQWAKDALGAAQVTAQEASIANQISNAPTTPATSPPLPWLQD